MACPDTPASSTCYFDMDAPLQSLLFMGELRKQAQSESQQQRRDLLYSQCLCDVLLRVNGRVVPAHKLVLAASSEYFASIFTGSKATGLSQGRADGSHGGCGIASVDVTGQLGTHEGIDDASFNTLVDYAYSKRVEISEQNVHALFQAADCLRFTGVKTACFKFLQRLLDVDNCMRMWLFAAGHGNQELAAASRRAIERNFCDVSTTTAFLELPLERVLEVLACDDLGVVSEEEVYKAAMAWVHYDEKPERLGCMGDVLATVRLSLLPHDFLMSILETDESIQNDLKCIPQLIAAIDAKVNSEGVEAPGRAAVDDVGMVQPRRPCRDMEEVCINRASGCRLGVAIMGGTDRPAHVFRQGSQPCIRITRIYSDGAASGSKLRTGDQILAINARPAEHLQHDQAIALISKPSDHISLLVRHDDPPAGLVELTLSTNRGVGFGLCIEGGANAPSGNPADPDDDGVFVCQILPGGAADQSGKLQVGHRILQANSISMVGVTHAEALQAMRQSVDRLHLMVCDGYDPSLQPPHAASPKARRKQLEAGYRSLQPPVPDYSNCVPY